MFSGLFEWNQENTAAPEGSECLLDTQAIGFSFGSPMCTSGL